RPEHALSETEQQKVLDVLHNPRFVDQAPAQVYAQLLEEGRYLCSIRTMYRLLADHNEVRERRKMTRHPVYAKPELLATKPNELWSWDITKLRGPTKWTYYHLYVIMDVYSRYIVGWMIAERESSILAKRLISESCHKQNITQEQLTLHADRGSSMKSKVVAQLLSDLGITKTHSRPHVSNDNPYSESQFKTMKYRPKYPDRFGSIQDARAFAVDFFYWYNEEHRHSGIALYAPSDVHYGRVEQICQDRQSTLDVAYQRHPKRFVNKAPKAALPPQAVWINPPKQVKN
ncbi:MAG: transposase, partial [Phycisphaerae bacterium]|nr:transposase [Phycisphaerae bacterium]